MTVSVAIMISLGVLFIFGSFFITEKLSKKESDFNVDLLTVNEDYEFSDRELQIIKRKIEDVIASHAKDIIFETDESLANMANEKTLALGDYAVSVCEEIEKNHKEVMFLYSMLDDKQKEIMQTVHSVDEANKKVEETLKKSEHISVSVWKEEDKETDSSYPQKASALEQLAQLSKKKKELDNVEEMQQRDTKESEQLHLDSSEDSVSQYVDSIKDADLFDSTDLEDFDLEKEAQEMPDMNFQDSDNLYTALEQDFSESENSNEIILEMHKNGNSVLDIAKELGLGVGEVKLVIDLYEAEA